jgi:hypothetical protein
MGRLLTRHIHRFLLIKTNKAHQQKPTPTPSHGIRSFNSSPHRKHLVAKHFPLTSTSFSVTRIDTSHMTCSLSTAKGYKQKNAIGTASKTNSNPFSLPHNYFNSVLQINLGPAYQVFQVKSTRTEHLPRSIWANLHATVN